MIRILKGTDCSLEANLGGTDVDGDGVVDWTVSSASIAAGISTATAPRRSWPTATTARRWPSRARAGRGASCGRRPTPRARPGLRASPPAIAARSAGPAPRSTISTTTGSPRWCARAWSSAPTARSSRSLRPATPATRRGSSLSPPTSIRIRGGVHQRAEHLGVAGRRVGEGSQLPRRLGVRARPRRRRRLRRLRGQRAGDEPGDRRRPQQLRDGLRRRRHLRAAAGLGARRRRGGPPTVADFDGDGLPRSPSRGRRSTRSTTSTAARPRGRAANASSANAASSAPTSTAPRAAT